MCETRLRLCLLTVLAAAVWSIGCSVLNTDRQNDGADASTTATPRVVASYIIESTSNGDLTVNKGEEVKIAVVLTNTGGPAIRGAKAKLSTTDPIATVKISAAWQEYGDLPQNDGRAAGGWYVFNVSKDTVAGHQIPFLLTITDSESNAWLVNFTVAVW